DRVAVAHPDGLRPVEPGEQAVLGADRDRRRSVLALARRLDVPAELIGHELGAIADAEDGEAAAPDRGVRLGRAGVVDRVRAARPWTGLPWPDTPDPSPPDPWCAEAGRPPGWQV